MKDIAWTKLRPYLSIGTDFLIAWAKPTLSHPRLRGKIAWSPRLLYAFIGMINRTGYFLDNVKYPFKANTEID